MKNIILLLFVFFTLVSFAEENNATIPVSKLENDFYNWFDRHKKINELVQKNDYELIFIGDSITHMFGGFPRAEIARGKDIWQRYYGHRKALNLGFGWDRTQNIIWRIENGEFNNQKPKVVVILAGTNNLAGTENAPKNSPQQIFEGILKICETINKKSNNTKILLLGLLPRSSKDLVKPILELNDLLATLADKDYISFINMHSKFADKDNLPKSVLFADGVHPNMEGYKLWAETIEPTLSNMLKNNAIKANPF